MARPVMQIDADRTFARVYDDRSLPRPYPHVYEPGSIHGVIEMALPKRRDANGWRCTLAPLDDSGNEFNLAKVSMRELAPGAAHGPKGNLATGIVLCCVGPSTFQVRLRDTRPTSPTNRMSQIQTIGEANPMAVFVPAGVVYTYKNVGRETGLVISCPSRLNTKSDL